MTAKEMLEKFDQFGLFNLVNKQDNFYYVVGRPNDNNWAFVYFNEDGTIMRVDGKKKNKDFQNGKWYLAHAPEGVKPTEEYISEKFGPYDTEREAQHDLDMIYYYGSGSADIFYRNNNKWEQ